MDPFEIGKQFMQAQIAQGADLVQAFSDAIQPQDPDVMVGAATALVVAVSRMESAGLLPPYDGNCIGSRFLHAGYAAQFAELESAVFGSEAPFPHKFGEKICTVAEAVMVQREMFMDGQQAQASARNAATARDALDAMPQGAARKASQLARVKASRREQKAPAAA